MKKALLPLIITASLLPSVAMAGPFVLARDSKSGIDIYALPDENTWCQPAVKLQFVANSPELYSEHKASILVRKLGKIFKKQCPQSQSIQVTAFNKSNGKVLTFANAFAPNWQLQPVQTAQAPQPHATRPATPQAQISPATRAQASPVPRVQTAPAPVVPVIPKLSAKEIQARVKRDNMRLDLMDGKLELIEYKLQERIKEKAKASANNTQVPSPQPVALPVAPVVSQPPAPSFAIRSDGAVVDIKAEQEAKKKAENELKMEQSFPKAISDLGLNRKAIETSIKKFFDTESSMSKKYAMVYINKINYQVISKNQIVAHAGFKYKEKNTGKERCCENKAFVIYKMPSGYQAISMADSSKNNLTKNFVNYVKSTPIDGVWEAKNANASYILTIRGGKTDIKMSDGRSPFVFKMDSAFNNELIYGDGGRSHLIDIQGKLHQISRGNDMIRAGRMTSVLNCYGCRSASMPDTWWLKYSL